MTDKAISAAAAILGRLGGAKGGRTKGKSKVRGDSAYYKRLRAMRKRAIGDYVGWGLVLENNRRVEYPITGKRQQERAITAMRLAGHSQLPIVRWTGSEWQDTGMMFGAR